MKTTRTTMNESVKVSDAALSYDILAQSLLQMA
jgi:hypothetical protein